MPDPANDLNREPLLRLVEQKAQVDHFSGIRRLRTDGGGGWFSLVFEAEDTRTGETVILKMFHPMERSDPYRWACFQRESTLLNELMGQRDIVRCVSPLSEFTLTLNTTVGPWPIPFAYIALERADTDVEQEILAGAIKPLRALEIFRAMVRAVQRAHARRIAHRDIKPGNFLVRADREIRLSDFGTARDFSNTIAALPRYDSWPGDTLYTAPEILAGLQDQQPEIAFGGDMFSLGATLFELFTGAPLAVHVFDQQFVGDISALNAVVPTDRARVYEQLVPAIASSRSLPSVRQFGANVPGSIARRIDRLYQSLAALDFRRRTTDFTQVFRQIDICVLLLRNQAKYDAWRDAKRRAALQRANRGIGVVTS